jgi:hypothetical protein
MVSGNDLDLVSDKVKYGARFKGSSTWTKSLQIGMLGDSKQISCLCSYRPKFSFLPNLKEGGN